jgi:hypothetical protein
LGKEVSAKAPGLFRAVADLVGDEVRQAAKRKTESRAARPSGLTRYFYVQDKDGNWVPSRERYIALIALVALGFLGFAYVMISAPSKPKSVTQAPSTSVSTPAPPPSVQAAEERKEAGSTAGSKDEASAAGQAQGQGAGSGTGAVPPPPSPLPGPNPNLPPPPDYVPTQEGQAQMEGLTVVYSRNSGGGGAGEGQGGAVQGAAFYARPKAEGEAGLALTPTRPPPKLRVKKATGKEKWRVPSGPGQRRTGAGSFPLLPPRSLRERVRRLRAGSRCRPSAGKAEARAGKARGFRFTPPGLEAPKRKRGEAKRREPGEKGSKSALPPSPGRSRSFGVGARGRSGEV